MRANPEAKSKPLGKTLHIFGPLPLVNVDFCRCLSSLCTRCTDGRLGKASSGSTNFSSFEYRGPCQQCQQSRPSSVNFLMPLGPTQVCTRKCQSFEVPGGSTRRLPHHVKARNISESTAGDSGLSCARQPESRAARRLPGREAARADAWRC